VKHRLFVENEFIGTFDAPNYVPDYRLPVPLQRFWVVPADIDIAAQRSMKVADFFPVRKVGDLYGNILFYEYECINPEVYKESFEN
jgi:hypothetical protein